MKRTTLLLMTFAVICMTSCTQTGDQTEAGATQPEQSQRDYYQLKIYNYESPDQEAMLDEYFQDALLPALHRAGIEHVGVLKPIEDLNETSDYMVVITPFKSLDQIENLPGVLSEDSVYMQSGRAYIDAPFDHPPYTRIESYILRAMSSFPELITPELTTSRAERVYELRSYQSATEKLHELKVEMFNEGESALFQELNFNPVFFSDVLSSAHMPHLMYMVAHADTTAQNKNWDAFGNHPEWLRMRDMERYQNTVSHITVYMLYPTEYSDY
jgi:NIPSNAP